MSEWFEDYGYAEVSGGLLIGAYPQGADDVAMLEAEGVTRVFNLVQDREYGEGAREACMRALTGAAIVEERLEIVDYGGLTPEQLEHAVQTVLAWLQDGQRVYLHCRAGWQRSAAVAAGVVALREQIGLLAALELIRRARPAAEPLANQREDLATWWTARRNRDLG